MLILNGFFKNNSFVPDREVAIPDGTRATISILETGSYTAPDIAQQKKAWRDFFEGIRASGEVLPDEFDEILEKGISFNSVDFT